MKGNSKNSVLFSALVWGLVQVSIPIQNSQATDAADVPVPKSMGVLGDSISAGAVASYQRKDAIYPWVQTFVLGRLLTFFLTGNVRAVEKKSYSWAGGLHPLKRVNSHAQRLASLNDGKFTVFNAAVSMQTSLEMKEQQMERLMDWSEEKLGQAAPDYVTILIGANNICEKSFEDMTPTGEFMDDVSYVVDEILEKSPNTRILISSLPNVTSLRDVAKNSRLFGIGRLANKCGDFWRTAKLCPTLTLETDPYKRSVVEQRVREYNEALEDLAQKRSEESGDRIRFAHRPYEVKFTEDDLAIDCFHPNKYGQNKFAEASWSATWWAGIRDNNKK